MNKMREALLEAKWSVERAESIDGAFSHSGTLKFIEEALAEPEPAGEPVAVEFIADLQRSRSKHPGIKQMFDGLLGEVHELKRAYQGDGDVRAEAFDVAVCAYRIATEGDEGENRKIDFVPDWMAWGATKPTPEAVRKLVEAVHRLLSLGGAIAEATDELLREAVNDTEADQIVREQAAAVLGCRAALAEVRAQGELK